MTSERIAWIQAEADRCEQIGAHRLAAWWRAEAVRVAAARKAAA